jgi:murein L,D-transpeptidase YafK
MKKLIIVLLLSVITLLAWKAYPFLPSSDQTIPALAHITSTDARPAAQQEITLIRVYKSKRYLELLSHDDVVKRYPIRLGFDPIGHKTTDGDGKTPEGRYSIDWRNAKSAFYKSLHISYPNQNDQNQAKARGVSAGGDVMIHGSGKFWGQENQLLYHYLPHQDWTLGCIAVSNAVMDDIWHLVSNGTVIEILP